MSKGKTRAKRNRSRRHRQSGGANELKNEFNNIVPCIEMYIRYIQSDDKSLEELYGCFKRMTQNIYDALNITVKQGWGFPSGTTINEEYGRFLENIQFDNTSPNFDSGQIHKLKLFQFLKYKPLRIIYNDYLKKIFIQQPQPITTSPITN